MRAIIDQMFSRAGINPTVIFESNNLVTIHNLTVKGFGVSIIPVFYATGKESVSYFLTNPLGQLDLTVAYRQETHTTEVDEYFITLSKNFYEGK